MAKTDQISNQVMELKELIAAPLTATVDADYIATRRYLDYLYEIAFESYDPYTGEAGAVRLFTFTFSSPDVPGKLQQVSIPLLTLVPLPLLQVKEADFDFSIQIVDNVKEERKASFSFKDTHSSGSGAGEQETEAPLKLRVSMAPALSGGSDKSNYHKSLSANMHVKVRMQQADIPGGLANLLRMAAVQMQTTDVEPEN
ncbi:MAG: DUF2589 domain-containing protein [Tannerellaceae bacterium]|nr:DUF2589 domain-containing protein [Tannerellaceae bacterium]